MEERRIPYLTRLDLVLHDHEVGVDAHDCCAGGEHDGQEEVELGFGPVVLSPSLPYFDPFVGRHCCEDEVRGSWVERRAGFNVVCMLHQKGWGQGCCQRCMLLVCAV